MINNVFEVELVRQKLLDDEKRISGRDFFEYRPITIETNVIKNADGSAIVTLGGTKVIAGVKAIIDKPFPDMPDEGSISIGVEMSPMSDPSFSSGPPDERSIELSRVVDRGIRESKGIDFKKLCIVSGEKVWVLFLDMYLINNDGNLFDACALAALAALKNTIIPELDESNEPVKEGKGKSFEIDFDPLLFTFFKIGDKIILDADMFEDEAADARFSVCIIKDGKMAAMQKGLNASFTESELELMIKTAKDKYKSQISYFK